MSIKFKEAINWSTNNKQHSIIFSRSGDKLVVGGNGDAKISVWNTSTGELIRSWPIHEQLSRLPYENIINFFSLSDNDELIANAGGTKLWDFSTGQIIRDFKKYSNSLELTNDGSLLVVFGGDITVWNVKCRKKLYRCVVDGMFYNPVLSSDGQEIVVKDDYKETIEVRIIKDWGYVRTINATDFKYMRHAKVSPDNKILVLSGNGGVRVIDYISGQQVLSIEPSNQPIQFFEHLDSCKVISFSPDSKTILLVGHKGYPSFWCIRTGEFLGHLEFKLGIFTINKDWSKISAIDNSLYQIQILERAETY
jgi:WD40 repeat protein